MVEARDHGYVLHTRRIHVTRYNVVRVGYSLYRVTCIRLVCKTYYFERVTMYNNAKRTRRKLQWFISTVIPL
jgi:hypothetical protein